MSKNISTIKCINYRHLEIYHHSSSQIHCDPGVTFISSKTEGQKEATCPRPVAVTPSSVTRYLSCSQPLVEFRWHQVCPLLLCLFLFLNHKSFLLKLCDVNSQPHQRRTAPHLLALWQECNHVFLEMPPLQLQGEKYNMLKTQLRLIFKLLTTFPPQKHKNITSWSPGHLLFCLSVSSPAKNTYSFKLDQFCYYYQLLQIKASLEHLIKHPCAS